MCITRVLTKCVLGVSVIGLLVGTVGWAQYPMGQYDETRDRDEQQTSQERMQNQQDQQSQRGQQALKVKRTSELIGKEVKDSQGETLGKINDLVLTPNYERVSYIALSSGGLWGIGGDLYAVPWSALRFGTGDECVLNISKQQIENTEGFNQDKWPSQPSWQWSSIQGQTGSLGQQQTGTAQQGLQETQRQGTQSATQDRTSQRQQDTATRGQDTRMSRQGQSERTATSAEDVARRRVTKLTGMDVRNNEDEKIGTIKEFVVAVDGAGRGMQGLRQETQGSTRSEIPQGSEQGTQRRAQQGTQQETWAQTQQQQDRSQSQGYARYGTSDSMHGGHVVYTVVALGGFWGFGEEYALVPSNAVNLRAQRDYARLDTTKETLEAIAFDPDEWPNLSSRSYAQQVYSRFDEQPYWIVLGYTAPSQEQQAASDKAWAADSDYNKKFDAQNTKTIEGTVENVGTFEPETGVSEGLRLRVRTDDGKIVTVYAGPQWYAQQKGFSLSSGDKIKVTGSEATIQDRSVILSSKIESGDKTLELRGDDGKPKWKKEGSQSMHQQQQHEGTDRQR